MIDINLNISFENLADRALRLAWQDRVEQKLDRIISMEQNMADDLATLETELNDTQTVIEGVSMVIDRLIADVEAHLNDPARIQAVLTQYRAQKDVLAAASARGTAADAEVNPPAPAPVP